MARLRPEILSARKGNFKLASSLDMEPTGEHEFLAEQY